MTPPIRVLIVDDSRIFRNAVENCLADEADIQVVGSVRSGVKALEFLQKTRPDMVTLDIEMPDMDGIETLAAIQHLNATTPDLPPIGVLMVSSQTAKGTETTVRALSEGAFDFITKPALHSPIQNADTLRLSLTTKIRAWKKQGKPAKYAPRTAVKPSPAARKPVVILIAVSTGGPKALHRLLPAISSRTNLPILVVQHMPPDFTRSLAQSLNQKCRHHVVEAEEAMVVTPGHIYIAPGGRHMLVRKSGAEAKIVINDQPPEKGCRPAADVLFRSTPGVWGAAQLALILTGMGVDGTRGAATLKRAGVTVLAQDEASCVVWGMPGSAVAAGVVDAVVSLDQLPDVVIKRIDTQTGA